MITFKARKLWGGDVSVQSFIVEYANKTKQKIKIEYGNGYMIVDRTTPYKVTAPTQIAQRTDQYIKRGQPYQLYDYVWTPVIVQDDYTLTGRAKMLEAWKKLKQGIQEKMI